MDEQTRKALELAREALMDCGTAFSLNAIDAIDAALSAPAAQMSHLETIATFHTAKAGRTEVATFFREHLKRHDFSDYIMTTLAADFACALAPTLHALRIDSPAAPVAQGVSKADIRRVFLANGFTIKEGCDDLKPYVYAAAEALLALRPAAPVAQPVSEPSARWCQCEPTQCEGIGRCRWHAMGVYGPVPMAQWNPGPEDIAAVLKQLNDSLTGVKGWGWLDFARAVLALRPAAPRAPMTPEKIDELSREMVKGNKSVNWLCRAIERAHGIGQGGAA